MRDILKWKMRYKNHVESKKKILEMCLDMWYDRLYVPEAIKTQLNLVGNTNCNTFLKKCQ
ncbi:hypothetical protein CPJCM30710_23220 [Clostridium polyendosporum]|uniref:Uncharacterized protein n=1 Tax=Clostridium polyendosporum TaxID=69208 RepID=A0A919VHG4_9CLOT|nr:hypothetical protein CPJCM30710_23220 [Clostridium polyendosporum]